MTSRKSESQSNKPKKVTELALEEKVNKNVSASQFQLGKKQPR
jgi:hypothetical protein